MAMDIEGLMLSVENRFTFVNSVAAEAKEYVEKNQDGYGGQKKAIFHFLNNRMNDGDISSRGVCSRRPLQANTWLS